MDIFRSYLVKTCTLHLTMTSSPVIMFFASSIFIVFLTFSTDSLAKAPKIPLVVVEKAQTQNVIKQIPLTGTVTSSQVSRLSSEVSGHVSVIHVDIGDRVKKGDPLLQFDREIEALNLKAIQAAKLQSQEELSEAKRRYESGKRLRKKGGISKEELEQRQANVKIAEAVYQRQFAEEQKQQAIVNRHTIKAPFNGVISEKLTEVGEWIDTGKPVFTLIAMNGLQVDFQVPQELYSQIDNKSQITIRLDAIPDKTFEGKIDAFVPVSDPDARTFLIRTNLDTDMVNMTPGMSAQGMLRVNIGKTGVVVPRDAIMRYRDGRVAVWVVSTEGESSKVSEQIVKTGHSFSGKVSIVEGLQAGTTIVVQGNESLKNGQTVLIHSPQ